MSRDLEETEKFFFLPSFLNIRFFIWNKLHELCSMCAKLCCKVYVFESRCWHYRMWKVIFFCKMNDQYLQCLSVLTSSVLVRVLTYVELGVETRECFGRIALGKRKRFGSRSGGWLQLVGQTGTKEPYLETVLYVWKYHVPKPYTPLFDDWYFRCFT